MLGRRGPAQAAFTSAELRELGRLDGVDLARRPGRGRAGPRLARVAGRGGHLHGAQERPAAARVRGPAGARPDAARRIVLRFLRSPVEIRGDGRVEAVDVRAQRDRPRRRRLAAGARRWTSALETIECGLVLRSVGYRAVPLPDVPVRRAPLRAAQRARPRARRPRASRCPASTPSAGSSAARPGSSARTSATPRRRSPASPRTCGPARCRQPPEHGRERIDALLRRARSRTLVTADGWRAIDAHEREQGRSAERPRVKLASRDELLAAAAR